MSVQTIAKIPLAKSACFLQVSSLSDSIFRVPVKTAFHDSAFIGFLPTGKLNPDSTQNLGISLKMPKTWAECSLGAKIC
jgi:hypothetical protein